MLGELKKMVIEAHKQPDYSDSPAATFEVMFNPNTYTQRFEIEYQDRQGQGDTGSPQVFGKTKPQEYTFEFVFDGTGTAAEPVDVQEVVEKFLKVAAEHNGDIHRPMYLLLSWGTLVSRCVLKSAETTYTLFQPDGRPLRAKVKATFAEGKDDKRRVAEQGNNSPDLTHLHTVQAGEHLSLLCDRYYGEPGRYLQVAAANGLTNYRRLVVGQQLAFPPVKDMAAKGTR